MNRWEELNDEQRRALAITTGPLLITAGPGTGKTKTLTSKIIHLLTEQGVPAHDIIALTFTKKAAAEMKSRVQQMVGSHQPLPFIGTFHALAHDLLTRQGKEVTIISEKDRDDILRGIRKQLRAEGQIDIPSIREFSLLISKHKSQLTPALSSSEERAGVRLYPNVPSHYNKLLHARGLSDYDDLLLEAVGLLEADTNRSPLQALLIDEFQDTNAVQYQMIKLLAGPPCHICAIGDPLQSIYGFRGATPHSFDFFKKDFQNTQEVTLTKNYRSGAAIIDASSALFHDMAKLAPQIAAPASVALVSTVNERTEAAWIAAEISRLMGGTNLNEVGATTSNEQLRFNDFAVIYRTHEVGRVLEQTFTDSGIPYQIIGKALEDQPAYELTEPRGDKVVFMTMHAAKGLEFTHVFIAGFEDGLIPYSRRAVSDDEIAEEKRLLFVAMTRAKQGLYLLRAHWRDNQKTIPSRFQPLLTHPAILTIQDAAIARAAKKRATLREQRSQLQLL